MRVVLFLLVLIYFPTASASLIQFESSGVYRPGDLYEENGLEIQIIGGDIAFFNLTDQTNINGVSGTKLAASNRNILLITSKNYKAFSPRSLDIGGMWQPQDLHFVNATNIEFKGVSLDGSVFTKSFALENTSLQLFNFHDDFLNLVSLTLTPSNYLYDEDIKDHDYVNFVMDNLSFDSVSVDSKSSYLFLLPLLCLLLRTRYKN